MRILRLIKLFFSLERFMLDASKLIVEAWSHAVAVLLASQGGLAKKCIYTLVKKMLYAKLTYYDYLNKNFEHPNLKITKIWVQQK